MKSHGKAAGAENAAKSKEGGNELPAQLSTMMGAIDLIVTNATIVSIIPTSAL